MKGCWVGIGVRTTAGELLEKGECRFRRRSASETMTGSGLGMLLYAWLVGGGGIDDELKREMLCGDVKDFCGSNLMGGSDIRDAMEGCVLAGVWWGGGGFVVRPSPFSEVYMTATFVEGEFMVPVSDHPIATHKLMRRSKPPG